MVARVYTFEGGTDESTITTTDDGSGDRLSTVNTPAQGGSPLPSQAVYGTAWSAGGGVSGRFRTTDVGGAWARWTGLGNLTSAYARLYARTPDVWLAGNTIVGQFLDSSNANTMTWRFDSSGRLVLADAAFNARYTSTKVFTNSESYRIEVRVQNSTTVGHMEAWVWWGSQLHDAAASGSEFEKLGNATDNWDTAANHDQLRFGIVSSADAGTNQVAWNDEVAYDSDAAIGPLISNAPRFRSLVPRRVRVA